MEKQDLGIYLYTGALVSIFIGISPLPEHIYNLKVPEMPTMPELPEMPALELPAMPDLPEIPAMKLPSMPELPEIPELPNLPELSLPEVNLPELSLPKLSLPESPDIELPSLPSLPEIPESVRDTVSVSIDSVTRVCGDLGDKIAAWPVWKLVDFKVTDNADKNSSISIETKDEAAIEATTVAEDDTKVKESQIEAEKAAASGDKLHTEENVPNAKIDNVEVKEEDGDVNIVEDLAMASEKIVVNVMEEISTKSDEHVVDNIIKASEDMFANIMESIEKIETIEIPEKIEESPSSNSEEPTLGDVENLDNMVATNIVERLVEASQDIVVNIMDLNPEENTIDDSSSTSEELPTSLDDKESLDNNDVTSGVESLAKASQNIIENIMELSTDDETNMDSETPEESHITISEETTASDEDNLDSNIASKGVESLVKASQDIVENIMELNTDETNEVSETTAENVSTNTEETTKKDESIEAEASHRMGG